jgi:hypothetical protein
VTSAIRGAQQRKPLKRPWSPAAGRERSLPVRRLVAVLALVQQSQPGSAGAEGQAAKADEDQAQSLRIAEY